ncbi:MAG: ribosome maturation factor RimP [Bacillota bacterium]
MGVREIEDTVFQLAQPIADAACLTLVDVELVKEGGRRILRVTLDKPGGVTLDDCELVSRQLEQLLDQVDPIQETYYLEVSSPGLNRKLKRDREFAAFKGRRVEVRTYKEFYGAKKFVGRLDACDPDTISIVEESSGELRHFDRRGVCSVRLKDDIDDISMFEEGRHP